MYKLSIVFLRISDRVDEHTIYFGFLSIEVALLSYKEFISIDLHL